MEEATSRDEWLAGISSAIAIYAAMLTATLAGQLGGIAVDAVIGSRGLWIPAACSVVLEALAGARVGAARAGGRLPSAKAARISLNYSIGLVALSVPLAAWLIAARPPGSDLHVDVTLSRVAVGAAGLVVATAGRSLLMIAFGPRRG